MLWFERERVWAKQGWVVYAKETTSKIPCPKCGKDFVVYNGNYFCDSYKPGGRNPLVSQDVLEQIKGECNWALAHPSTTKRDRKVCDLIGIDYF